MRKPAVAIVFSWLAILGVSTAVADDWTAVRLRGGVFALENGGWTQLVRGSVVSDDRVIKSAPGGRITLVRGSETIELGSNTTAQISDRSVFTTVYNHEGTVGIDAEARNVKHFAVQTPFLAAVVKARPSPFSPHQPPRRSQWRAERLRSRMSRTMHASMSLRASKSLHPRRLQSPLRAL